MNGHANGHQENVHNFDVIVVGAGISGINTGYRLQTTLPDHTYTILEGRAELGGTWSLFKYPGVRSDSDLHTFGFPFYPWQKNNPIASGESICDYMKETAEKFGIDKKIQYRHRVVSADWSSETQQWRLEVDHEEEGSGNVNRKIFYAKFIILGSGYYDYDKPLQAKIPGLENFKGTRVHPQFWPKDLDYAGKKMVIIGSGATTVTILPAVVDGGVGKVTMLQRSPSFVMNMPQKKPGEKRWYDYLPRWMALRIVRFQFIVLPWFFYLFCRTFPNAAANLLRKEAKAQLPKDFEMNPHFFPTYNPWDQRLCLCPDSDFFKAFETDRAEIVTATIKSVVEDGILLYDGPKIPADIIVTATGLKASLGGKIALTVDKQPVVKSERFLWHNAMLTGVPNLGFIIGYANASWTLGSDSAARLLTRLIKFMEDKKYTSARPRISPEEAANPQPIFPLKSTYVKNALPELPATGNSGPWLMRSNYLKDSWNAGRADLNKGMEFESVSA